MGMAAANNKDLFVKFFDLPDTAVIQIPGRMFPVEIEHIPQKDRISPTASASHLIQCKWRIQWELWGKKC